MFNTISEQANKLVSLTNNKYNNSKTKVMVITSGKGGVGKSTLTSNISYLLSLKNKKVAVLDADIGLANLQVMFDIKPEKSFFDYIDGNCELKDILLKTAYKDITLIAGKSGYQYSNLNKGLVYSRIVDDIVALDDFDILLIDTGAGLSEHVQQFLNLSDNIMAVTTTDPSALTDVYALLKMISLTKEKLMLCFNHTAKYDTGKIITKSITNLAIKNKLNRKFMVQYVGNMRESRSISTTGRLRKLFTKELDNEIVSLELELIVENILKHIK
ncbi:MAG: P-loop NTPase [Campylobacterota bacterium]|nr:P-loop NTPase [Campylobacterota bacterium]